MMLSYELISLKSNASVVTRKGIQAQPNNTTFYPSVPIPSCSLSTSPFTYLPCIAHLFSAKNSLTHRIMEECKRTSTAFHPSLPRRSLSTNPSRASHALSSCSQQKRRRKRVSQAFLCLEVDDGRCSRHLLGRQSLANVTCWIDDHWCSVACRSRLEH